MKKRVDEIWPPEEWRKRKDAPTAHVRTGRVVGVIAVVVVLLVIACLQYIPRARTYTLIPGQDLSGDAHYVGLKQDIVVVQNGVPRRLINQSSFSLSISSPSKITRATIDMDVQGDADVYAQANGTPVLLYSPKWKNYTTVATINDTIIQVRNDKLAEYTNFADQPDVESWILANVPRGTTLTDDNKILDWQRFENNDIFEDGNFSLNVTLRGTHTFYVRAHDILTFTITKTDLNWYPGEDNLTVALYDMRGQLIANQTIGDDGIAVNLKTSRPQHERLEFANLSDGVYKVIFKCNEDTTFLFDVNSRLVDVESPVFPLAPSGVYFECVGACRLSARTSHVASFQTLTVGSSNYLLNRTQSPINFTLGAGAHALGIPAGDVVVSGFSVGAFDEASYFRPYRIERYAGGAVLVRNDALSVQLMSNASFEHVIQIKMSSPSNLSLGILRVRAE